MKPYICITAYSEVELEENINLQVPLGYRVVNHAIGIDEDIILWSVIMEHCSQSQGTAKDAISANVICTPKMEPREYSQEYLLARQEKERKISSHHRSGKGNYPEQSHFDVDR